MEIESKIKKFLAENVLFTGETFGYGDDDSFLEVGIIDSVGVMELLEFVQEEFKVTVDPEELTPDNFDSVNKLAAFIRTKLSVNAAA